MGVRENGQMGVRTFVRAYDVSRQICFRILISHRRPRAAPLQSSQVPKDEDSHLLQNADRLSSPFLEMASALFFRFERAPTE